jgi:hypothetical protein
MKSKIRMTKTHLLAAELFSYSYDNYADHLEVGNERFTKLMPKDVETLRRAVAEKWSKERIARQLEIEDDKVDMFLERFQAANEVVFAPNPSESFRQGVKQSIKQAIKDGLNTEEDIDELVIQICYRAADLGYLLDLEGSQLSDYSEWLRRVKDADYSGTGLPNLE